jgi:hypothetical protein
MRRYSNWLDIEGRCRYLLPSPNLCAGRRARWHAAARPHDAFCCPPQNVTPWSTGSVQRPSPLGWRDGGRFSSSWPRDTPSLPWGARWRSTEWAKRFLAQRLAGLSDAPGRGAKGGFSPGGRHPRGTLGRRTPGSAGSQPVPVGLYRTGAAAHRHGDRGGHLRRHRAPDSGRASAEAVAPAWLALCPAAAGRGLVCHGLRAHRALYAPASCRCAGALCG